MTLDARGIPDDLPPPSRACEGFEGRIGRTGTRNGPETPARPREIGMAFE